MRIHWTDNGEESLRDLERYMLRFSEKSAQTWVRRVLDAAASAADSPWKHRMVPEANEPSVREVLIGDYRLWFRVLTSEDQIDILVVFHGSREVPM